MIKKGRVARPVWAASMLALALLSACGGGSGSSSPPSVAPSTESGYTLSVSVYPSGSVTSTPAGISCSASCAASFGEGMQVTLVANPSVGYAFSGWSGACSGSGSCVVTMNQSQSVTANFSSLGGANAPLVLYTDALTAPTYGGENNLGGYLSIFGKNFGAPSGLGTSTRVYIGGVEVANYRYLGPSKVGAKLGIQQITVQVGHLGGAAAGQPLPVAVVVNGVASSGASTFVPTAGRVLFVSLTGNDQTAVPNDIAHPWRSLQDTTHLDASGGLIPYGAYFSVQAGDQIVIRGGHWSDTNGVDGTWMKAGLGAYARYGTASAWIGVTAYPGPINGHAIEDVHYTTPARASGGIDGPWSAVTYVPPNGPEPGSIQSGQYWSISNLRMDVSGGANRDAAPINFQYGVGPWRVVNNELGPWVAGDSAVLNAAGISGHGNGNQIFGNYIHDIQGLSDLQNHGIYSDSMSLNWEIAYNWILNATGGSAIQFNDNQGCAGQPVATNNCGAMPGTKGTGVWAGFTGMRVHHNWLENAAKYGINYNDQNSTRTGTYQGQHWNNVIIGTALPPIRINSTQPSQQLWFAYNTVYDCMTTVSGTGNAYVRSEGFGNGTNVHNVFYDNIFAFATGTVAGTRWFASVGGVAATTSSYDFKSNLYFSAGQSPTAPGTIGDTLPVVGDPLFSDATHSDFSLSATSPAIAQSKQPLPGGFSVTDDFTSLKARPMGGYPDIGAFERD